MEIRKNECGSASIRPFLIGTGFRRLFLVGVTLLIVVGASVCMFTSVDRVFRLSDGSVQTRFFFAGIRFGVLEYEDVLRPLRVDQSVASNAADLVVAPRQSLLFFHSHSSTHGMRMIGLCKTLRDALVLKNASQAEIDEAWSSFVAEPTEERVMSLLERLVDQTR